MARIIYELLYDVCAQFMVPWSLKRIYKKCYIDFKKLIWSAKSLYTFDHLKSFDTEMVYNKLLDVLMYFTEINVTKPNLL